MAIAYDLVKNEWNIRKHGLSFTQAESMDFTTAVYLQDKRREYGEPRYLAVGYLGKRLHVLCYAMRAGQVRAISFRKANPREAIKHGKTQTIDE